MTAGPVLRSYAGDPLLNPARRADPGADSADRSRLRRMPGQLRRAAHTVRSVRTVRSSRRRMLRGLSVSSS